MKSATTHASALAVLAAAALLAACAGTPQHSDDLASRITVTQQTPPKGYGIARKAAMASQAATLYVRNTQVEPVLRPVSYTTAVSSLLLKSLAGTAGRVSLAAFEMPSLDGAIPAVGNAEPMDLVAWEAELDRVTRTKQSLGTIEFLIDGEQYFERLEAAINDAEESIDIRTYIFDNDDYAVKIADMLKRRSEEDVDVRVLIDTLGNMQAMQADAGSLPNWHVAPLSMSLYLRDRSDVAVRNIANPWITGDHTKTTIIDRKVAFLGGMNIGREYRYEWHDLMVEVRGPVVDDLQFEHDKAWSRAGLFGDVANFFTFLRGKRDDAGDEGYPVRILQTKSFDSDIYKAQLAAIRNAQSYILIENAYFSDDRTLYELAQARRRGVDVRVILPTAGNHGPLNASNQVAINQMLEHGIRVYLYPGMSHVKAAVFDGWACVGSANFDKLSLKVNKELNIATSHPATVAALIDELFIPDLMLSTEISEPVDVTLSAKLAEVLVDELL